jgi:HSP20 family protein
MNAPVEIKKGKTPVMPGAVNPLTSFRQEMDTLFDRFAGGFGMPSFRMIQDIDHFWPTFSTGFEAAVDLTGDDKTYRITAEFPGVDEKDLEVTLGDDYITVKAETRQEKEEKGKDKYVSERIYGVVRRSFALPGDVNRDAIDAKFEKGVLTVALPRKVQVQPSQKKIEVRAA